MRFLPPIAKAFKSQNRKQLSTSLLFSSLSRFFSQLQSQSERPHFGIVFDIDGVIVRGESPMGGSLQALKRLYDASGSLKIPYIFLTNGGGFPESKRALELSKLLGVDILPLQNEFVVAVGKGEPAAVMSEYGFKNVLSIDEYAFHFDGIDPLARYKTWTPRQTTVPSSTSAQMNTGDAVRSQRVQAAFIVSDSVDWGRDIQAEQKHDREQTGGDVELDQTTIGPKILQVYTRRKKLQGRDKDGNH